MLRGQQRDARCSDSQPDEAKTTMTWWNWNNGFGNNYDVAPSRRPTQGGTFSENTDFFSDVQESEMVGSICDSTGYREHCRARSEMSRDGYVVNYHCNCGLPFRLLVTWAELLPLSRGLSPNIVGWKETTYTWQPDERMFVPTIVGHSCRAGNIGPQLVKLSPEECRAALDIGIANGAVNGDRYYPQMVAAVRQIEQMAAARMAQQMGRR